MGTRWLAGVALLMLTASACAARDSAVAQHSGPASPAAASPAPTSAATPSISQVHFEGGLKGDLGSVRATCGQGYATPSGYDALWVQFHNINVTGWFEGHFVQMYIYDPSQRPANLDTGGYYVSVEEYIGASPPLSYTAHSYLGLWYSKQDFDPSIVRRFDWNHGAAIDGTLVMDTTGPGNPEVVDPLPDLQVDATVVC